MFSSLFVCLLATLRENFGTDLHEIFTEGWQWATEQTIKFRWLSGPLSGCSDCFPDSSLLGDTESAAHTDSPDGGTGKTCLGGGMHCPSASSYIRETRFVAYSLPVCNESLLVCRLIIPKSYQVFGGVLLLNRLSSQHCVCFHDFSRSAFYLELFLSPCTPCSHHLTTAYTHVQTLNVKYM